MSILLFFYYKSSYFFEFFFFFSSRRRHTRLTCDWSSDVCSFRSRLEGRGLCKTFKRRRVVDNVGVHVEQGEIVGLLGPNGAGKTTTFYLITGLIRPDQGSVTLD